MQLTPLTGTMTRALSRSLYLVWMQLTPLTGTMTHFQDHIALVLLDAAYTPHGDDDFAGTEYSFSEADAAYTPHGDDDAIIWSAS